ncbi:hypothetical protein [Achromobacter animicus]|uniref:hypothetical protein n=1 Tax=Achromobacter animicus TaxID=1389935 RepID=UPI00244779FC|nr:hypothetical protein [Achromobacter animicus]MDH0683424.1 GIY-YIG nuclease family protein [Achromobacter animicus]
MKSHVYLIVHRSGRRFKIGKANDIIQRARRFGLNDIDWTSSVGLEVQSAQVAVRLERILLRTFDEWRLSAEEVAADAGVLDGATEWMRSDCRRRVDLFLAHVEDIFPYVRITGETLNTQVKAMTTPILELIAKRARNEAERVGRREARVIRHQAADDTSRTELEAALLTAKRALWQELERHINTGSILGMAAEGRGWTLLLMDQAVDDHIWQLSLQETQFSWSNGAGGLVSSISEYRSGEVKVCAVHLGTSFYDGWPIPEVTSHALADVTEFLRSLSLVDLDKFNATLEASIFSDFWSQDARDGLNTFIDKHLPILQSRNAARASAQLF